MSLGVFVVLTFVSCVMSCGLAEKYALAGDRKVAQVVAIDLFGILIELTTCRGI